MSCCPALVLPPPALLQAVNAWYVSRLRNTQALAARLRWTWTVTNMTGTDIHDIHNIHDSHTWRLPATLAGLNLPRLW